MAKVVRASKRAAGCGPFALCLTNFGRRQQFWLQFAGWPFWAYTSEIFGMLKRMTLVQKGALLVATLFVFELSFISLLIFVNNNSELSLSMERRATEIIAHIAKLHRFLDDAVTSMASIEYSGDNPADRKKIEKAQESLLREVAALKASVKGDPAEGEIVNRFDKYVSEVKQVSSSYLECLQKGKKNIKSDELVRLLRMAHEIEPEHEALLKVYETEQKNRYLEGKVRRRRLITLMWCGVVLNIIFAVGSLEFFGKVIGRRLRIMIDNIARLERKVELNPIMGHGQDEIEVVDRRFHQMADELVEAEKQFREVEKLKHEFVTMISHDLRAPLTSLQFTLGLLKDGTYGQINNDGSQKIQKAEGSVRRLVHLINDLLDLEKMGSGTMKLEIEEFFIDELFSDSIAGVSGMAESKGISLETQSIPDMIVEGDRKRLIQVFVNLLSNAVKFSPPGSKILLSAEEEGSGFLKLSVRDEGPGIPEEFQSVVFERFKQVENGCEPVMKSTGLGLAIAKSITELHSGIIGVNSNDGKGSTFWVRLPTEASGLSNSKTGMRRISSHS